MQPMQPPPVQIGDPVTFVACPTYRDTDAGRKSGCWLADDPGDGTTYDVSLGLVKPQVGQAVLVEGIPTDAPATPCGGTVLSPVRTSVLRDACPRSIIPAEDFPGRPYKSPPEQLKPASEPRMLPPGPYDTKEFTIYFEFGRDFLVYQYSELILEKISLYVKASQAKQVRVEGFAATRALTARNGSALPGNSRQLREEYSLARSRAEMVAEALRRLGVPADTLRVEARGAPAATQDAELAKLPEVTKRRVVITVTP
jgi:outer membrane protein OmpA-like peptidoglycan-associated protein